MNSLPIRCPEGSYSIGGQHSCTGCPAGYFCPSTTEAPKELCPIGSYSTGGQSSCTVSLIVDCSLVLQVALVLLLLKHPRLLAVLLEAIHPSKHLTSASNVSLGLNATIIKDMLVNLGLTLLNQLLHALVVLQVFIAQILSKTQLNALQELTALPALSCTLAAPQANNVVILKVLLRIVFLGIILLVVKQIV
jgi:hypothetical protein